jgi:hypothetical protein
MGYGFGHDLGSICESSIQAGELKQDMVQLLASMEELVIFLLSSLDHHYFNLFSSVYWCSLVYHT